MINNRKLHLLEGRKVKKISNWVDKQEGTCLYEDRIDALLCGQERIVDS